jgi:hypothetical protein
MDWWHRVTQWLDYNRGLFIGLLVAGIAAAGLLGCQVRTDSISRPGERVTAGQLDAEITMGNAELAKRQAALEADAASFATRAEAAKADIERQAQLRATVIQTVAGLGQAAAEGSISPASAIGGLAQLLLLGAAGGLAFDNRRKDRVLAGQTVDLSPAGTQLTGRATT